MNFFQHQADARKRTRMLVVYYLVALFVLAVMFYALVVVVVCMTDAPGDSTDISYATRLSSSYYFDPLLFLATTSGVVLVVGGASVLKSLELAGGGGDAVAQQLGGQLVVASTRDFKERQLLNVVEEMAIAAGINVPNVYVLDHEYAINAFAAGFTPNTAAIGVTRGTLQYLTRDELQGVIAHEFSHVLNGDMRINIRMIGILFGLNLLLILGWTIFRIAGHSQYYRLASSRDKENNSGGVMIALFVLGLGFVVIGSLGMLLGSLIQAAISRQREFLADASAVQFTRNPDGIAGALKKIGCPNVNSRIRSPNAGEASHMFIANILGRSSFAELMATHPPLVERIRRIDPGFNGVFPASLQRNDSSSENRENERDGENRTNGKNSKKDSRRTPSPTEVAMGLSAVGVASDSAGFSDSADASVVRDVVDRIGTMERGHIAVAEALICTIPASIHRLVHEITGARAVVCSLLLDSRPDIRKNQLAILSSRLDSATYHETLKVASLLAGFPSESRIPLVQIAFPTLRQLSREQYRSLRFLIEELVAADHQIDLFEYTLRGLLLNDLDIHFGMVKPEHSRYFSLQAAKTPWMTVLSFLAYAASAGQRDIHEAFKAGLEEFGASGFILPKDSCTITAFDAALKKLALFSPQIKERLMRSFCACLLADRRVTAHEGELLRAIAANLNCPMPPWVGALPRNVTPAGTTGDSALY